MLAERDRSPERLTGEIVDRRLSIVQYGVWNTVQMFVYERSEIVDLLSDSERAHLLVIADDRHTVAEVPGEKAADVGLAGLVHDHHVETTARQVHRLRNARERHDPHRHGIPRSRQQPSCFFLKLRHSLASSLSNFLLDVRPPLQRLLRREIDATLLPEPSTPIDEIRRHSAQVRSKPMHAVHQEPLVQLRAPLELGVELTPLPSCFPAT